jgi:hypothetical protein
MRPRSISPLNQITQLNRSDQGRQAWSFLVAATLIEVIVWGLPFSVGVLHEYWVNELFAGQGKEGTLTTAATL